MTRLCTISGFTSPPIPKLHQTSRRKRNERNRQDRKRPTCKLGGERSTERDDVVLAIDMGTSAAKCGLISMQTGILRSEMFSVEYAVQSSAKLHMTQRKLDWYNACTTVTRCAVQSAYKQNLSLKAIAVTGQMQDLLACGVGESALRDTQPLLQNDVILYSDSRSFRTAQHLSRIMSHTIDPTSILAKLALLNVPNALHNYRFLFGAADFVVHHLTFPRLFLTDPTTLSTTGLAKPPYRAYDVPLLRKADLQQFIPYFPDVQQTLSICGYLCSDYAEILRYPSLTNIPIIHAGGDAAAVTFGAGCVTEHDKAYLYIGTSGWLGVITRNTAKPTTHCKIGLFRLAHPHNSENSIVLASLTSAGSNFTHAASVLLNGVTLAEFDRLAERAAIGANGVVYVPYLAGRRCPWPDARAAAGLYGVTPSSTRSDIARAVVEGVAFAYKRCADVLRDAGFDLSCGGLCVVGGAARSDTVLRALANAIGVSVFRGPGEHVGLKGAARSAVVALGEGDWIGDWVVEYGSRDFVPDENARGDWIAAFRRWMAVVESFEKLDTFF